MSKPHDGSKYLANVQVRSKKKLCIQRYVVMGGTTATGYRSMRERKEYDAQ